MGEAKRRRVLLAQDSAERQKLQKALEFFKAEREKKETETDKMKVDIAEIHAMTLVIAVVRNLLAEAES